MLKYYKNMFMMSIRTEFNSIEVFGGNPKAEPLKIKAERFFESNNNREQYDVYLEDLGDGNYKLIVDDWGSNTYKIFNHKPNQEEIKSSIKAYNIGDKEGYKDGWKNIGYTPEGKQIIQKTQQQLKQEKKNISQIETNKPVTIDIMEKQRSIFKNILKDNDISKQELDSINYNQIEKILRQAFSRKQEKDTNFIYSRESLLKSINDVINEYKRRRSLSKKDFPKHIRFEEFIVYKEKVENGILKGGIDFIKSLETMSLSEKLNLYTRLKENDQKRYTVLSKIIEKEITEKGYYLSYSQNGEIVLFDENNKEIKDSEIIKTITQKDLRGEVIRDIIGGFNVDITKGGLNYKATINKILNKNFPGGEFVFEDLQNRKDDVIKALKDKLNKADRQTRREINFVLDYLNNKQKYPQDVIVKANQMAILRQSGYDPTTNEGLGRIAAAFKDGHGIQTLINDVMRANGGKVGAFLILGSIIALFAGGKWRKRAFIMWGIIIGGPAAEELINKWGGKDIIGGMIGKLGQNIPKIETSSFFKSIDIKIKGLPEEYQSKYNKMYKLNEEQKNNKLNNQDYAQIFSQLVQKKKVRELDIKTVRKQIEDGNSDLKSILGNGNIPSVYIPGILTNDKGEVYKNRTITKIDVKRFLILLLSMEERGDKTLGDLFVSGQKEEKKYLRQEYLLTENKEINKILEKFPFGEERTEIIKIIKKGGNNPNKKEVEKIIKELKKKKNIPISSTSGIGFKFIDDLIKQYEEILNKLEIEVKIEDYKHRTLIDGELLPGITVGTNLANKGITGLTSLVGYFKLIPNINIQKLEGIQIGDIDKLIQEGKDLEKINSLSNKQKKELKEIIIKLMIKKLALLKTKDRLGQSKQQETQKTLASLIEINHKEYEDKLNSIKLQVKPKPENLSGYSNLLVQNYKQIIFLEEIVKIDNNFLGTNGKSLKQKAKDILTSFEDQNNGFEANIKNYISTKRQELVDIENNLSNTNLIDIIKYQKQFLKIKSEFINETFFINLQNKLADILNLEDIQESDNSLENFENYYQKLFNKKLYSNNAITALENLIKQTEDLIKDKVRKLIESRTPPMYSGDINVIQNISFFIIEVKQYRKLLKPFKKSYKELIEIQEKELVTNIEVLENEFIKKLKGKDLITIVSIYEKWEDFSRQLDYEISDKFKETYKKELERITEKKLKEEMEKPVKDNLEVLRIYNEFIKTEEGKKLNLILGNTTIKELLELLSILGKDKSQEHIKLRKCIRDIKTIIEGGGFMGDVINQITYGKDIVTSKIKSIVNDMFKK